MNAWRVLPALGAAILLTACAHTPRPVLVGAFRVTDNELRELDTAWPEVGESKFSLRSGKKVECWAGICTLTWTEHAVPVMDREDKLGEAEKVEGAVPLRKTDLLRLRERMRDGASDGGLRCERAQCSLDLPLAKWDHGKLSAKEVGVVLLRALAPKDGKSRTR